VKLTLHRRSLPLRHPSAANVSAAERHALIVELEQDGICGYGEAAAVADCGATIGEMTALLAKHRREVESHSIDNPAVLWEKLRPLLGACPATQCAVDMACHDLWGKLQGAPIWKLWGLSLDDNPPSSCTIVQDTIEAMEAQLREMRRWPIYRLELGTPNDLDIVRALRQQSEAVFRVDANCRWTPAETIVNSLVLGKLGVEFIEQPLAADDWAGMTTVFEGSSLPAVADESCRIESDVDRCVGHFQGINIKLAACGGMTPARRMIARAKELGLKVMMSSLTESTGGVSAAAQFLPLLDYAALDGALRLADDAAIGVRIERGFAVFPDENGCGVNLLED
jgi:L-Ala-D/L-Glu epimerase